jgi:hypothetical protein
LGTLGERFEPMDVFHKGGAAGVYVVGSMGSAMIVGYICGIPIADGS